MAVKQSSRGIESEIKYRHVRGTLKIERCPRISPHNVVTDTYVLNFAEAVGTANDGEELTARKQAHLESLSGIWIRFYGKTGTQIGEWKSGGGLKDIKGPE